MTRTTVALTAALASGATILAVGVTGSAAAGTVAYRGAAAPTLTAHHTSGLLPLTTRAKVGTAHKRGLGTFLVNARTGRTLYLFKKDTRNHSNCTGACTYAWPPLMTQGKPKAVGKAKQSKLGTIPRGGSRQVTYNGHPLYTYAGDSGSGQTNGEGISSYGGEWYVVNPKGHAIDNT